MDKIAAYKEYIMEKVALNAEKARAMAKEIGLVPDGQWRYALRNLRNNRGELFTGKTLSEAKQQLGSVPNNTYQKIKAMSKTLNSTGEVGGTLNKSGDITSSLKGPKEGGINMSNQQLKQPRLFHTHPTDTQSVLAKQNQKKLGEFNQYVNELKSQNPGLSHDELMKQEGMPEFTKNYLKEYERSANSAATKGSHLRADMSGVHNDSADFDMETTRNLFLKKPHQDFKHNIFSGNTEAIHKLKLKDDGSVAKRSIYFTR